MYPITFLPEENDGSLAELSLLLHLHTIVSPGVAGTHVQPVLESKLAC